MARKQQRSIKNGDEMGSRNFSSVTLILLKEVEVRSIEHPLGAEVIRRTIEMIDWLKFQCLTCLCCQKRRSHFNLLQSKEFKRIIVPWHFFLPLVSFGLPELLFCNKTFFPSWSSQLTNTLGVSDTWRHNLSLGKVFLYVTAKVRTRTMKQEF